MGPEQVLKTRKLRCGGDIFNCFLLVSWEPLHPSGYGVHGRTGGSGWVKTRLHQPAWEQAGIHGVFFKVMLTGKAGMETDVSEAPEPLAFMVVWMLQTL